jgi:hypothetical protein
MTGVPIHVHTYGGTTIYTLAPSLLLLRAQGKLYIHDAANRLTNVNGQAYTWGNNGNPSLCSGQA